MRIFDNFIITNSLLCYGYSQQQHFICEICPGELSRFPSLHHFGLTSYFDDVDPDHLLRDFPSWLVYFHHILILIIVLFSKVC